MLTGRAREQGERPRRWLQVSALVVLAVALATSVSAGQARAAPSTTPQIKTMAVSVIPEYDQPRVLVSFQGEIDGTLPMELSIRLPADAEISHACSLTQPDNGHVCESYTIDPDGESSLLKYQIVSPVFYVEYYYGSVSGAGQRNLDFTFWPPYPVESLQLWVHEPARASDFALSPGPGEVVEDKGSRQHGYTYTNVTPEQPLSLQMTYAKSDAQPSVSPSAAGAASAGDSGRMALVLSLVGVAAVAVVAYAVVSRRR
ncbi:MAG: hypothetical protein Q8P22_13280, partial [Chloroflexota bacterium]|nr:hypothetical protein [Chloroflexota bacterium]